MFTIKYRSYSMAAKQSSDGPWYDEHELIDGPFAMVSKEYDDGYAVVHAHRDHNSPGMMFGPFVPSEENKKQPRPTLWVMNENGATVAKYDL